MTIDIVYKFLTSDHGFQIGYSGIRFKKLRDLDSVATGFEQDFEGMSFNYDRDKDWPKNWLLIGYDRVVGDPVIIDAKSENLVVMTAIKSEKWQSFVIADSFTNFVKIVEQFKAISTGRENPEALQQNPYNSTELNQFMNSIRNSNPKTDVSYWQDYFKL